MANLVSCKECGKEVAQSASTCPHCGVDKPGVASGDAASGCVGGVVMLLIVGGVLSMCMFGSSNSDPKNTAVSLAEKAEAKRKGFHCLSSWDGSHSQFKASVKKMMRDPKSFEHVETRVTPIDEKGQHGLVMTYRARNGFGGMNSGIAIGNFSNSTCAATVVSVD